MEAAAATVNALLSDEIKLHVRICGAEGISESELLSTIEAPENLAYTRYVLEVGYTGTFVDLMAVLAPCIMGYGEIGYLHEGMPMVLEHKEGNPKTAAQCGVQGHV